MLGDVYNTRWFQIIWLNKSIDETNECEEVSYLLVE